MSKTNFLDSINVESPCVKSWSEMRGDNKVRFCDHCAENVNNLSRFTRKEARRLVRQANGSICVRYVRRPDGRIETLKKNLHQISRQTGIAAGVLGASLGVSTAAYAQQPTTIETARNAAAQTVEIQTSDQPNAAISGTLSDPNGAVVPFALVTIFNEQTGFYQTANTNQDGFYEFKNLSAGTYKLKFEAGGFEPKETAQISVGEGAAVESQNAQLSVQSVQEQVSVGGNEVTTFTTVGLIALSTDSAKEPGKLFLAVENENLADVKKYIAQGKRVNGKEKSYGGNSPLHVAVENGNLEIAEILLNAGAKVNSKNADKRTPLMMLDEDAAPEFVNLLILHGAKINLADKAGNTALIFAASYATREVVQTLISSGADVNAVNKLGETALMNAAQEGDPETVRLILSAGANVNARNRDGKTAFDLTEIDDAKQFLTAYGAR